MALFEIFNEITEKNIVKSETGDPRIFGVVVGIVTKNYQEGVKGRVCVQIPTRDKEANEIQWAKVAMPSSGEKWGHYFLPEVGDQVLLVFENGNIERPYVIGCIPKENSQILQTNTKKDNNLKTIRTKSQSFFEIDDGAGEGESKKESSVTLQATGSKQTQKLEVNNEMGVSILTDKGENNFIKLMPGKEAGSGNGKLIIKTEAEITIQSGNTSIVMNGKSNTITIKADNIKMEAQQGFEIKASTLKMEGSTATLEGQSVKVEGSTTVVGGQTVKIG